MKNLLRLAVAAVLLAAPGAALAADKKPVKIESGAIKPFASGDTVPVANGGTGATSQSAAASAILPAQSGHSGEFLTTNGTTVSWGTPAGGGGGTITAKDEGSTLTTGATSIDCVGAGITCSNTGAAVTLTVSGGGGGGYSSGTSFPGSPSSDDVFYRTDRDILYFYDGTRWLSVQQFVASSGGALAQVNSPTSFYTPTPFIDDYDIYVEKAKLQSQVTTGTTSANYWVVQFFGVAADGSTVTNIGASISTQNHTQNQVYVDSVTVNAVVDTTNANKALGASLTKTGTPSMNWAASLYYRLIG